jgi:cyclase
MKTKLLILFLLLFGIMMSCQKKTNIIPVSKHFNLEKLTDGVYAAIADPDGGFAICNAGIIDLGDKTVVLDPFISPIAARDLKQLAEYLTGKPVSMVINLDPHNDHNGGNQVFVPEADIVSTPNARKYINDNFKTDYDYYKENAPKKLLEIQKQLKVASGKEKAELILWQSEYQAIIESLPELKMTLPNTTITDTMIIYGSQRRIVIIPTGTGHTNGDMVVWLPVDKIIFMSDQLFVKAHPYLGDGDPESLKNNLKSIIALNPEIAVPGHGPVGDVNSLHVMVDYIETISDLVKAEIQKGTDENKVLELPMPEMYNDWIVSSFYKMNLKFLYHKLMSKTNPE